MSGMLQAFLYVLAGMTLIWFGYTLFFNLPIGSFIKVKRKKNQVPGLGAPGAPRTCPVCNTELLKGERVKSVAYPSMGGAEDRYMHISGCTYCLDWDRRRACPVCGKIIRKDEILVARLYDKPNRSHVHVIGCSKCKLRGK